MVIFSMDVCALYPSIKKEMAARAIMDAMNKADMEWKNIDITTLVRHVSLQYDRRTLKRLKLSEVVPNPKSRTTFNSFINPRKNSKISNGENQFDAPVRLPTVEETKRLIGLLTANATTLCMENHYYTIGGSIRKQADGGSIGSDLTGETARVYMIQWDKKLEDKCKEMGLKFDMYKRYVDDQVIIMRAIGCG